jgi:hypothetical protein
VEPEAILATQRLLNGTHQVLIHCANLPNEDSTGEDFDLSEAAFPDFHLEDKVKLVEGS